MNYYSVYVTLTIKGRERAMCRLCYVVSDASVIEILRFTICDFYSCKTFRL